MRMFDQGEGGGCLCISVNLQLFFTKCMSISVSIFCGTKLCTAWNYVGKILTEISVCRMFAKTFYYFSIWIL